MDCHYEAYHLVVELDGQLGHTGTDAWRDWRRDNRHLLDGLVTLRFGWFDVLNAPCEVALAVVTVLRRNGWPGSLRRCGNCP